MTSKQTGAAQMKWRYETMNKKESRMFFKLINYELNDFHAYKEYRCRCIGFRFLKDIYFAIHIYYGKRKY